MKSIFNSAFPYILSAFMAFVAYESYNAYYEEHKTATRLTDDLSAAQKENAYYVARNKDQAVKIQAQELTIKEIRATVPSVIADLKNLYIAPRQLQSYTAASTEMEKHITANLRDSTIAKKSLKDSTISQVSIKILDYRDKWFTVKGTIQDKTADLVINSRDSLIVVNYISRRPHPWLWIFGGRRHPESAITNKNPFNKYSIEQSISVKK